MRSIDALGKSDAREAYEPPSIEDIPVRAEEQVMRGCKQANGSGVGSGPPTGCTVSAGCLNIGPS